MITPESAERHYEPDDSAHGFGHVLRVWRLAQRISQKEASRENGGLVVDLEVLRAAVLLHDVGRGEELRTGRCHAQVGAARAREILRDSPPQRVDMVAQAIAQHRFRGEQGPSSPEAQILYDADKLDAIGATGVARAYAVAGAQHQRLWANVPLVCGQQTPLPAVRDLHDGEHTPVHEYLYKLARIREHLYTGEGRRIAEGRHEVLVAFFDQLAGEMIGTL